MTAQLTICDKLSLYALYTWSYSGWCNNGWKSTNVICNEVRDLVINRKVIAGLNLTLDTVRESLDKFCILGVAQRRARCGESVVAFHAAITCNNGRAACSLRDNIEREFVDNGYFAFENRDAEQAYEQLLHEASNSLETVYKQQVAKTLKGHACQHKQ